MKRETAEPHEEDPIKTDGIGSVGDTHDVTLVSSSKNVLRHAPLKVREGACVK